MKHKNKGMVLLVTLWILAILSLLAIGIGFRTAIELRLISYRIDSQKAYEAARAGLTYALNELFKGTNKYDTIWECGITLAKDETAEGKFRRISTGDGYFDIYYTSENGTLVYGIEDMQSRININTAGPNVLKKFYPTTDGNTADNIVTHIMAWRGDALPTTAKDDSVDPDAAYKCKNAPFNTPEELLLIKDFAPEVYYGKQDADGTVHPGIKDLVTVYGPTDQLPANIGVKVNINTASEGVLELLLRAATFDDTTAAQIARNIVGYRAGPDGDITKTQDNPPPCGDNAGMATFVSAAAGSAYHADASGGGAGQAGAMTTFLTMLAPGSSYFRIRSTGTLESRRYKIQKTISCVVNRNNNKITILSWLEE